MSLSRTFVIAEIGVNHNGDRKLALKLVDAAVEAGADAAKFQTFRSDAITVQNAGTVAYQREKAGALDQHAMLRKLELGEAEHEEIAAYCARRGIEFMSTAFDSGSLDLLCRLGIRRIKAPSGEVTNLPYLEDCARRGLPIILSTGMADLEEVRTASTTIEAAWDRNGTRPAGDALTILHCTSAYPTAFDDVNLRAMLTLETEIGRPVGYSDHTQGIFVPPIAVAMGARVIEKHVTLDRRMEGPDHSASLEPDELAAMVRAIRDAELLRGDGIKVPREAELEARQLVRRGLKAARDLPAGAVLGPDDVAILRPATGLPPDHYNATIGTRLSRDLAAGTPITIQDLAV